MGLGEILCSFSQPPCKPPTGKEVLERLHGIVSELKTSYSTAAWQVASELIDLWKLVDSGIPLVCRKTVYKQIMSFYDEFCFVRKKSSQSRGVYQTKVSLLSFL